MHVFVFDRGLLMCNCVYVMFENMQLMYGFCICVSLFMCAYIYVCVCLKYLAKFKKHTLDSQLCKILSGMSLVLQSIITQHTVICRYRHTNTHTHTHTHFALELSILHCNCQSILFGSDVT